MQSTKDADCIGRTIVRKKVKEYWKEAGLLQECGTSHCAVILLSSTSAEDDSNTIVWS